MTAHIALLRAVNVGGRTLRVADLVALAVEQGLKNPRTLLTSGNLVFEGGARTWSSGSNPPSRPGWATPPTS